MSGSSAEFIEFSGQKKMAARLPEKNSFSQKCSLLSQYLKENGSFGDLSGLGISCNNDNNNTGNNNNIIHAYKNGTPEMLKQATMNLFPVSDKQVASPWTNNNIRSMDLFPQQSGFMEDLPKRVVDSSFKMPAAVSSEAQNAQLTIFYGGQVMVFNDFPADKAKEVMLLASKSSSLDGFPSVPVSTSSTHPPVPAPALAKSSVDSNPAMPCTSNHRMPPPQQAISSDLPIARRASLHRFLEKRKDRITAKAPYQTSGMPAIPSKPAPEIKSWLGLAAQSSQ